MKRETEVEKMRTALVGVKVTQKVRLRLERLAKASNSSLSAVAREIIEEAVG